jgi:peptidoglycan/xylan/chitin deacetylase (PgdA/CDA1 family)
MCAMIPRDRAPYSAIVDRPPLRLPDDARLVLWPVLALEDWDIGRPMARMVISPPQGQPQIPDAPNWSWHEYGMRVGFWRLKALFERLGISPTVTVNAKACLSYPRVIAACRDNDWEFNAHGFEQMPMHKVDDQRTSIRRAVDIVTEAAGRPPRGWFGPGLTETHETLDHLAAAGIEYIGDWVFDDEPCRLATDAGPIVALPYNFEIHDIVMMLIQNHPSEAFRNRAIDYFDCLYEEGAGRAKIMALGIHPYISGSPHRIRYVAETLEHILARPGVVVWNGEQILDWFNAAQPA